MVMDQGTGLPKGLEQLGFGSQFHDTLCRLLEEVAILRDLSRQEIEQIARHTHAYSAHTGVILFEEGKKSNYICFLVKGQLTVDKERNLTERRPLTTIRPGRSVGEMSMIDGMPHSATVTTATDVELIVLTRHGLQRLQEEHPRTAYNVLWKIAETLSFRLRQTTGQLVDYL